MTWQRALSPHQPVAEARVATIADAYVTPLQRGPLRTESGPRHWMTGAVHDESGRLVPESQRSWNGDPLAPVAADPEQVVVPDECRRLAGRWIYAGHWTHHFGHFLVEVLTNLWPDPAAVNVSGVLAHRSYRGTVPSRSGRGGALKVPELRPWQEDLLALAGYGGLKVRIVRARPVRIDELVVPSRPVLLKSWAQDPAVAVWRRVGEAVSDVSGRTSSKVFFSRSRYHASAAITGARVRTSSEWEQLVEARFVDAGFSVLHPEELSIGRQIEVAKEAGIIAGLSGSALHLSAFAPERTKIVELGDERSPRQHMPTQAMIDAALGHRAAFVPYCDIERLDDVLRQC